MVARPETAHATLKRLFANGPLTALPTRPADLKLLLRLAAARLQPGRHYSEAEINEALREWLATFSAAHGIDHVTLRRSLVDIGHLQRDRAGSTYRLNPLFRPPSAADPAAVLDEIRRARADRKRRHAA
jgi:hypothetical protein